MKAIIKTIFLILISFFIIYFMAKYDFLHIESIKVAFIHNRKVIFLVFCLQIISCFFTTLRYFSLLKIFQINVDFKNVTAATFVSNSLGLWMPGSMAFIEIIRIGLMLGANNKIILDSNSANKRINDNSIIPSKNIHENKEQLSFRSRLTTVSLFDRLIGLWAMLFAGIAVLFYSFTIKHENTSFQYSYFGIFMITAFTLFLLLCISFLPILSRKIFLRKIIGHVERLFLIFFKKGFMNRIFKKIFFEINSILDAIALGGKKFNHFLIPVLCSFVCVFIQAISMYYCALAISTFIPFTAILATVSILAIATLLPIGFGGIGGVQFIAAISMSFFGVMPQSAASAQLLQTTINLISISFVGLFFSKLTSKQIKSVLKIREIKKLSKIS